MSGVNSQGYIGVTDRFSVQAQHHTGVGDQIDATRSRANWSYDSATGMVMGTGVIYFNDPFQFWNETSAAEFTAKVPLPADVPTIEFQGYSHLEIPMMFRIVKSGTDSIGMRIKNQSPTDFVIASDYVPFSVSWLATVNKLA